MAAEAHAAQLATTLRPWRCPRCRHDARASLLGTPCTECGEPLTDASVRPAWLDPVALTSIRRAAILAATATIAFALLPLLAAALSLALPIQPGRSAIATVVIVVGASALAAQFFAGLRLLRAAIPVPTRYRALAFLILRVPLILGLLLGTMVLLVTNAMRHTLPGGFYTGGMNWFLTQAIFAIPAIIVEIALVRTTTQIATSVSDDRTSWKHLTSTLMVISYLMILAGLLCMTPFNTWILGPILLLLCHAAHFVVIARVAGLHLPSALPQR